MRSEHMPSDRENQAVPAPRLRRALDDNRLQQIRAFADRVANYARSAASSAASGDPKATFISLGLAGRTLAEALKMFETLGRTGGDE
jgi:hypothetical protein